MDSLRLDHVLISTNFSRHEDILPLRQRYGHVTVGWLVEVYGMMSASGRGGIRREAIKQSAEEFGLGAVASELIDYCLEEEIFSPLGDLISNSRVLKDREKLVAYRKRKQGNQKSYRERLRDGNEGGHERETPDTDTEVLINNKETVSVESPAIPPTGMIKVGKYARISPLDLDLLQIHTPDFLAECWQAVDDWVDKLPKSQVHLRPDRIDRAGNCALLLRQWIINDIRIARNKLKKSEPHKPQPKPPSGPLNRSTIEKDLPSHTPTPEEKARNRALVDGLVNKTAKEISA